MALEVNAGVVGIAVGDDFHGNFFGIAPPEGIGEVTNDGSVFGDGISAGNSVVDVNLDTVQGTRICTPGQFRVGSYAVDLESGQSGSGGRGQDQAGNASACALDGRDCGADIVINRRGDILNSLGYGRVKVVGADDCGCQTGSGVDTVNSHEVQAAGNFSGEAVIESLEDVDFFIVSRIHELVRNTSAIFNLDRHDGFGGQGDSAMGFCAVFRNDINFRIHGESELFLTVEWDRGITDHCGKGRFALYFVYEISYELRCEEGTF